MIDSDLDDDSETCSSRQTTTPTDESSKKQNHSEIEKRRRDKMNTYITELSGMVPMCSAMSRKLDKLTVLRMAVHHMKTLRGSRVNSYTEGHYKPSFLSDAELKHLILQSAEGFLFVVSCYRGRLLYISESVSQVLNYTQSDLLGQPWFDILHPEDIAKVKDQLSSSDLAPRERFIDAKTMLPVRGNVPQKTNRLCPGARRSFFCRMKNKTSPLRIIKEESENADGCQRRKKSNCERKFSIIHCTGYLKSWTKVGMEETEGETDDPCNLSCLVAVGRILQPITSPPPNSKQRPVTFISRHAIDGKFVFVDQRTTLVIGFLPQELLWTSMHAYLHPDDVAPLNDVHKAILMSNETLTTPVYRFRTRNGSYIRLQSEWRVFRNPWTREMEYIIAKNILPPNGLEPISSTNEDYAVTINDLDLFAGNENEGEGNGEIQRLVSSASYRGERVLNEAVTVNKQTDPSAVIINSPEGLTLEPANLSSSSIFDLQIPPMLSPASSIRLLSSSMVAFQSKSSHTPLQNVEAPSSFLPEGGSEDGLSNRTNDPVMSSTAPTGPNNPIDPNLPESIESNNSIHSLRNASIGLDKTDEEMLYMIGESVLPESPHYVASGDGNDEAAMAVVMSLLEADAGLGGPVDFSGLPWPLP